jgi:hypothetical protein
MRRNWIILLPFFLICIVPSTAAAQAQQEFLASNVTKKSVNAIGYPVGKSTKVDLKGSDLMPQGSGEAKVAASSGVTSVEAAIQNMAQPSTLGTEFSTWPALHLNS